MADLVSVQTGNWLTASTWNLVTNSQTTGTTFVDAGTSYTYTPTFTIANGEVIQGVIVHVTTFGLTSGTFTIALSDDNGVTATREVTLNTSTLISTGYRYTFCKFASTLTADGGSDYRVGFKRTSGGDVRFNRSSTAADIVRYIVGSNTQAPAAGDMLFVIGNRTSGSTRNDITVTMNETALTAYNGLRIVDGGTLTWDTTTNTQLQFGSGLLAVQSGGIMNMGTSGSPIPRTQTSVLEFVNASDGASGMLVQFGGVANIYGQSRTSGKNIVSCKLNTDEAAAQTVLGVDTDTGWKSGDEIAISSTTRTASQHEQRTLSGDAGASSITVSSGLTNAHSGTSPTQAEVVLLTRNVQIRSNSSTFMTYITVDADGALSGEWFDVRYSGSGTSTKNCALRYDTTLAPTLRYCCFRDGEAHGLALVAATTSASLQDCTVYNCLRSQTGSAGFWMDNNAVTFTMRNLIVMGGGTSDTYGFRVRSAAGSTLENWTACSANFGAGTGFWPEMSNEDFNWTLNGFNFHSNTCASGLGLFASLTDDALGEVNYKNGDSWYNSAAGMWIDTEIYANVTFENVRFFGNTTTGLDFRNEPNACRWYFKNCLFAGTSSFSQPRGLWVNSSGASTICDMLFEGTTFGVATGIFVAHSTADMVWLAGTGHYATIKLVNCSLASTTPVSGFTPANGLIRGSYIASQQHGQTVDARVFTPYGTLAYETTTVDVSPAMKLTPSSSTLKLVSNGDMHGRGFLVPINSGATRTVTVKVRKDGSYTGNQPRLIQKVNPGIGVLDDVVLDTMTVGANTWEILSGTTAAATLPGVAEFIVDCDGTAGNVFVDSWSY